MKRKILRKIVTIVLLIALIMGLSVSASAVTYGENIFFINTADAFASYSSIRNQILNSQAQNSARQNSELIFNSKINSSNALAIKTSVVNSSNYFDQLFNYIDENSVVFDDGYKALIFSYDYDEYTYYWTLQNIGTEIYFELLITSISETEYIGSLTSFILNKNNKYITVELTMLLYYGDECLDALNGSKTIDRSTYHPDNNYTLPTSGNYLTSDDYSEYFNVTLEALCTTFDAVFYDEMGFGLEELGFRTFPGFGSAVCDIPSEYHIGGTYLLNRDNGTCLINGYTGDTYCSCCDTKISPGFPIIAIGSHLFLNDCASHCDRCNEKRDASHNYNEYGVCEKCGVDNNTPGDVDGNTIINTTDLALLKKLIATIITSDNSIIINPDIDSNNVINTTDLALLKKKIAKLD